MVEGCQYHIVADKRPVPDEDSTLILEPATAVDKYIFTDRDVLPQSV